jgi:hypothetical protein
MRFWQKESYCAKRPLGARASRPWDRGRPARTWYRVRPARTIEKMPRTGSPGPSGVTRSRSTPRGHCWPRPSTTTCDAGTWRLYIVVYVFDRAGPSCTSRGARNNRRHSRNQSRVRQVSSVKSLRTSSRILQTIRCRVSSACGSTSSAVGCESGSNRYRLHSVGSGFSLARPNCNRIWLAVLFQSQA